MNVPGPGRAGDDLADWFGADAIHEQLNYQDNLESSDTLEEEEASDEQHDDLSNEEHAQDADISDHEEGPRRRGIYKGTRYEQIKRRTGRNPILELNDINNAPKGANARMLSEEFTAAHRHFSPLCYPNAKGKAWSKVPLEMRQRVTSTVVEKFDFIPEGDERWPIILHKIAGKTYSELRCRLKEKYEKNGKGERARRKVPKGLGHRIADWVTLCDFFDNDPDYKKRSTVNIVNRDKMLFHHTAGTKSFMNIQLDEGLSEIGTFERTHKRKRGESCEWVNSIAEEKHKAMVESHEQNLQQCQSSGEKPKTQVEIMREVLGHKSGYSRGLGYGGPKPPSARPQIPYVSPTATASTEQIIKLENQVATLQDTVAQQKQLLDQFMEQQQQLFSLQQQWFSHLSSTTSSSFQLPPFLSGFSTGNMPWPSSLTPSAGSSSPPSHPQSPLQSQVRHPHSFFPGPFHLFPYVQRQRPQPPTDGTQS